MPAFPCKACLICLHGVKPPKCAEVANKCACPNPWVEFLSKNANAGKTTMAQHSAAYKRLKDSGAFALKPGMNNGPCKSDPVKLCAWKLRRKAGHKDLQTPAVKLRERRNEKIIARKIGEFTPAGSVNLEAELAGCVADIGYANYYKLTENGEFDPPVVEKLALKFMDEKLGLSKKGIHLRSYIGAGLSGNVFSAWYYDRGTKRSAVVKLIRSRSGISPSVIEREVYNHKLMNSLMPDRAPKLYKAFQVMGGNEDEFEQGPSPVTVYGLVMEKIGIELFSMIPTLKTDKKLLKHVARQLKDICDEMEKKKIVHRDFHHSNMGFKMIGGKPRLYVIDFEYMHIGTVQHARARMWDDSRDWGITDNLWKEIGFEEPNGYIESLNGAQPTASSRSDWWLATGTESRAENARFTRGVVLRRIPKL
jgi:hypothetical protein